MKNRFILPIFTFLLLTVISCSKDDPDITDKDKKDEPTETTAILSVIGGCDSLKIHGAYNAGVVLDESNYIEIPVEITKAGTFTCDIEGNNGFGFKTTESFTEVGKYKLKLTGYGTPEKASIDGFYFEIADFGCTKPVYVYEAGTPDLNPLLIVLTGTKPWGETFDEAFTQVRNGHGELLWNIKRQSSVVPVVENDVLYTVAEGVLYSQNVLTGEGIWSVEISSTEYFNVPLVSDNNYLYLQSSKKIYAIDKTSGANAWVYEFEDDYYTDSSPIVVDEIIYTEHHSKVFAISSSGNELWRYTPDVILSGGTAISDGKIYISKSKGGFITLDISDGNVLWTNSEPDFLGFNHPTVYNGKVFVKNSYKVYCIDGSNGEYIWQINNDDDNDDISNITVANDMVYTYDIDGKVLALDINSGSEIFRSAYGSSEPQTPVALDGLILIPALDGITAKNAFTGDKIWDAGARYLNHVKSIDNKKPAVLYNTITKQATYPTESGMVQ